MNVQFICGLCFNRSECFMKYCNHSIGFPGQRGPAGADGLNGDVGPKGNSVKKIYQNYS